MRRAAQAWYKTLNSRKSALFGEFHVRGAHACPEQPVQIPVAQQPSVQLQGRSLFRLALFRGPRDRPRAEKAAVVARPDVPRQGVPGPGAQLPRSFPRQFAVSDRKQEPRTQ